MKHVWGLATTLPKIVSAIWSWQIRGLERKTSFWGYSQSERHPTGLSLVMFLDRAIFHPCSSCESAALYYLPLNYTKSHDCLLLMETVSSRGWLPALMTAGFAVEQLCSLGIQHVVLPENAQGKVWQTLHFTCVSLTSLFGMKENCRLARDLFVQIPFL